MDAWAGRDAEVRARDRAVQFPGEGVVASVVCVDLNTSLEHRTRDRAPGTRSGGVGGLRAVSKRYSMLS